MKKRCYNKNVDRYNRYGALNIIVCEEWRLDFKSFYDWSIKNGWKEGLTIERINVEGNYCPENCCYIPLREQYYNLKNTFWFYYKGNKIPFKKVCNLYNYKKYKTVWALIKKHNYSFEDVLIKYPEIEIMIQKYLLREG